MVAAYLSVADSIAVLNTRLPAIMAAEVTGSLFSVVRFSQQSGVKRVVNAVKLWGVFGSKEDLFYGCYLM